MIRACAVVLATLIPQNLRNGRALGLSYPHLTTIYFDAVKAPVSVSFFSIFSLPYFLLTLFIFFRVNSRILPPPVIRYINNASTTPESARATWNQRVYYYSCSM